FLGAMRASALLENPDRLIGVILIGSNFVNALATSLATIIAIRLWGESGVWIASLLMAAMLLIFTDMTPKTIGALYPESIAYPSSFVLYWLLKPARPVVWLLSNISNYLVRLLGFHPRPNTHHELSKDELRTLVDESSRQLPAQRQSMLLNVLDLEKVTVNDIMVPRNDVSGIDLDADIDAIMQAVLNSQHTRLPVYNDGDLNNVVGILHMRNAAKWLQLEHSNKAELMQLTQEAYFVPESTPLPTQLFNFQKNKMRIALVVDEYGVVIGLITLEDILEEIVGNFTTNLSEDTSDIYPQEDGTYVLDGSTSIRDLNRALGWQLPTDGPKTLNGLLMEELENIPDNQVGIRLYGYYAEILQTTDNLIKSVRMWVIPRENDDDLSEIEANVHD
ncbi:MAG: HlyC/CorC family transporter, partial [Pseudomonadota bacterium]